jgi:hypothetical protein
MELTSRTCNICLDESTVESWMFVCPTCVGFVCGKCLGDFDPSGSIFGNEAYVKKTIKCPCCRQMNWDYHFRQIIRHTLGDDLAEYERDAPCHILFVSNQESY